MIQLLLKTFLVKHFVVFNILWQNLKRQDVVIA